MTFDPTSGRDPQLGKRVEHLAPDQAAVRLPGIHVGKLSGGVRSRGANNVIANVENKLGNTTERSIDTVKNTRDWFSTPLNWFNFSSGLISVLIWLLLIVLVGSVGWFLYERWKIRPRMRRLDWKGCRTMRAPGLHGSSGFTMTCCDCWHVITSPRRRT